MHENLKYCIEYVSKNKSWIFVSIIKSSIICSMLLLLFTNNFYYNYTNKEVPESQNFQSKYESEGNNVSQFIRMIVLICLKAKMLLSCCNIVKFFSLIQDQIRLDSN